MEEDRGMVGNFVLQASGSIRFKVAWMRILIWSSGFMIFLTLSIIMGHWTALYF